MTITNQLPGNTNTALPQAEMFARTVPFFVERHSWGEHRKASINAVDVMLIDDPAKQEAAKKLLSLRKRLLNSEQTRGIRQHDTRFRERLQDLCAAPWRPSLYLISFGTVEQVYDAAIEWADERGKLADAAAEEYPTLIEPMREQLGPLFNEFDYPPAPQFRARFWVSYGFIDIGVPNVLARFREDVFQRETARVRAEAQAAGSMIQNHLRAHLLEITEHLAELLSPKANGRMPALREGSLDRLFDFLSTIEARDVTGDGALRTLVRRLRSQTAGSVSGVQDLRDDDELRARVAATMTQTRDQLQAMVVDDAGRRAIFLRDEVA